MVETEDKEQRERHAKSFMSDVKTRLKEVSGKAYIDPQKNTVDYVLLFIPNDQIYAFMHQRDRSLLDEALKIEHRAQQREKMFAAAGAGRHVG